MSAVTVRTIALPTFRHLLEDLAAESRDTCGARIVAEYGWFSDLTGIIESGKFDVAFATSTMTSYLEQLQPDLPTTRSAFCRLEIGVGVAPGCDIAIGSVAEFRQTVVRTKSIGIPPAVSTAGRYLADLFERLGVADSLGPRLRIAESGDHVATLVAAGELELGITLANEFALTRGVKVAGLLPAEIGLRLTGTVAVNAASDALNAATLMVRHLQTPRGVAAMARNGLVPIARPDMRP
jgi:molybdate transport system substrate-binding protein